MGQSELMDGDAKRVVHSTLMVKCQPCGGLVPAELVTGAELFPDRPDLGKRLYYVCPFCGGHVGVHPHTVTPLGVIATEEVKNLRYQFHHLADPMWRYGFMGRREIYARLSKAVGHKFHAGECADVDELKTAISEVRRIREEIKQRDPKRWGDWRRKGIALGKAKAKEEGGEKS